ncbi:glycoside hydrolase family 2 protein, partial [Candidatus Latescibacterota bacterium]
VLFSLLFVSSAGAEPGRWEREISGTGWKLWLDRDAEWLNDDIYLPPVDISAPPINPPTCGWKGLEYLHDKIVSVPGTVEEHFWGANGNPVGNAGDFRGVSWWSTTFELDSSLIGKRFVLAFDSVNLRAEVYVNGKLAGYDVIGNSPFTVDITDMVTFGETNRLNIRVTDPVGNFNWNDNELYPWGENIVPGVHGFGGITGKIYLRATDVIHIDDIYMQNKTKFREVEAFITLGNSSGKQESGSLSLVIHDYKNQSAVLWEKTIPVTVPAESKELSIYVNAPEAKLWGKDNPNLYVASATFTSDNGTTKDTMTRRFGFRWFNVGEKNGDKRFYINGERVFLFAAMSRGFWPKNGIFPTPEMALRDINTARKMGYNTAKFHRAIGQEYVMNVCDEKGHFAFEEPGGYRCMPEPDETAKIWRREKVRRMVMRDRSHPSVILYNFKNEAVNDPSGDDVQNMKMVHTLDPTRIVTYNSDRNRSIPHTERLEKDPIKMHMLPFDNTLYYHGWWDQHHWIPYVGYLDEYYENPQFYLRSVVNQARKIERSDSLYRLEENEIIFWGEEGAGGTMVSLGKIKNELERISITGWREREHIDYYHEYDRFLDESGFRSSFPTVDDLTMALGKNLHYYHGRALENVRMSNIADAYVLNGWASGGTHSDLVDAYRNPTGDPSILAYYSQPLYLAVKIRDKAVGAGFAPIADIFIINEVDLKGRHKLEISLTDPEASGNEIFTESYNVRVTGGEEFGQLLIEDIQLPPLYKAGYYKLSAKLLDGNSVNAIGWDDIFVIDYMSGPGLHGSIAVIDTSGIINSFLKESRGVTFDDFNPNMPHLDYIIIGAHNYREVRRRGRQPGISATDPILDRVVNGTKLIILEHADLWAQDLDTIAVQYINTHHWGRNGRLFTGKSDYLKGLPQSQSMNWEYQVLYEGDIWGLGLGRLGVETIVAVAAQHRKEILDALCRIPFGNGSIYLNTMRILPELASEEPQSAAPKKIFLNLLETTDKKWGK